MHAYCRINLFTIFLTPRPQCRADEYTSDLDGQWIDITGVPAGKYTLRNTINSDRILVETDYSDNTQEIKGINIVAEYPCSGGGVISPQESCAAVGTVCGTDDNCCTTLCHHTTLTKEMQSLNRFLRKGEHKKKSKLATGGECICTEKKQPCKTDVECCSNKCTKNKCRG